MTSVRRKKVTRDSMIIEHLVSPDEFLRLLSDFVSLSKSRLTDEECEQAEQLADRIAGLVRTEQGANLRSLVAATGFVLQTAVEQVISDGREGKGAKAFSMKFKETFQ